MKDVLVKSARDIAAARGKKPRAAKRPAPTSRETLVREVLRLASNVLDLSQQGDQKGAAALLGKAHSLAGQARESDRNARDDALAVLDEISLMRVLASLGTSMVVFSP